MTLLISLQSFLFDFMEKQRTEEHHLYSLCYMHLGSPKVCYGIPGRYCFKFVEVVKRQFPQICLLEHPELLHELVSNIFLLSVIYNLQRLSEIKLCSFNATSIVNQLIILVLL